MSITKNVHLGSVFGFASSYPTRNPFRGRCALALSGSSFTNASVPCHAVPSRSGSAIGVGVARSVRGTSVVHPFYGQNVSFAQNREEPHPAEKKGNVSTKLDN